MHNQGRFTSCPSLIVWLMPEGLIAAQVSATIIPCTVWHVLCKLPFTNISADVGVLKAKGYVTEASFKLDGQLSADAVTPDNTYAFYEPVVRQYVSLQCKSITYAANQVPQRCQTLMHLLHFWCVSVGHISFMGVQACWRAAKLPLFCLCCWTDLCSCVQVQQGLDSFLLDKRPNRLMLLVLSRRVKEGFFNFEECKKAVLDKAWALGKPVACLVISGDAVTISLSDGRQLQKPGSSLLQTHEALNLIDRVRQPVRSCIADFHMLMILISPPDRQPAAHACR